MDYTFILGVVIVGIIGMFLSAFVGLPLKYPLCMVGFAIIHLLTVTILHFLINNNQYVQSLFLSPLMRGLFLVQHNAGRWEFLCRGRMPPGLVILYTPLLAFFFIKKSKDE